MTGNPVPFQLWPEEHRRLIPSELEGLKEPPHSLSPSLTWETSALQYLYATTWICELIVHLEEVLFVSGLLDAHLSNIQLTCVIKVPALDSAQACVCTVVPLSLLQYVLLSYWS